MFIFTSPVLTIISILGLAFFYALIIGAQKIEIIRKICLFASFAALVVGVLAGLSFDKASVGYQYLSTFSYVAEYNSAFALGVDGLSYIFLILTLVTFPFLFLAAWTVTKFPKHFFCHLLAMELLLVLTFVTIDLFYFFILFESLLIPMFILIGVWGARTRKIKAAYYFFLYTLFGSLFMLFGMIYLYQITGSLNYYVLLSEQLDLSTQKLLWLCFFLAFAVKMPLFPFHIWLPEAHVEAPTVGSMLLASLLLKLGGYGLLRFSLTFLGGASIVFTPLVATLAIAGVIYGSLSTIRQIDMKRIIAYSSIAHMNLVALGIFSFNRVGIEGAIYLMVAHAIVSAALFFCVGVVYDRTHTRLLRYYGGFVTVMPVFAAFFFIFNLANMGFPGTPNFIGELLMLAGIFILAPAILFFAAWGIVFSATYSTILFAKTMFGTLKTRFITQFVDVNRREAFILSAFAGLALLLGLRSDFLFAYTEAVVWNITSFNENAATCYPSTTALLLNPQSGGRSPYVSSTSPFPTLSIFIAVFILLQADSYACLTFIHSLLPPAAPLLVILIPLLNLFLMVIFSNQRCSWRHLSFLVIGNNLLLLIALLSIYPVMLEDENFTIDLGVWFCVECFESQWTFVVDCDRYVILLAIFLFSTLEVLVLWEDLCKDAHAAQLVSYLILRTFFLALAVTADDLVMLLAASHGVSLMSYLTLRFWSLDGQPARFALGSLLIGQISDFFLAAAISVLYSTFKSVKFDVIVTLLPEITTAPPLLLLGYAPLALSTTFLVLWLVGKAVALGVYAKTPKFVGGPSPAVTFSHALSVAVFTALLIMHMYPLLWAAPPMAGALLGVSVFIAILLWFSAPASAPFYLNSSYPLTRSSTILVAALLPAVDDLGGVILPIFWNNPVYLFVATLSAYLIACGVYVKCPACTYVKVILLRPPP